MFLSVTISIFLSTALGKLFLLSHVLHVLFFISSFSPSLSLISDFHCIFFELFRGSYDFSYDKVSRPNPRWNKSPVRKQLQALQHVATSMCRRGGHCWRRRGATPSVLFRRCINLGVGVGVAPRYRRIPFPGCQSRGFALCIRLSDGRQQVVINSAQNNQPACWVGARGTNERVKNVPWFDLPSSNTVPTLRYSFIVLNACCGGMRLCRMYKMY